MPLCRGTLRVLTVLLLLVFGFVVLSQSGVFYPWGQCLVSSEGGGLDSTESFADGIYNKHAKVHVYAIDCIQ